MNKSFLSNTDKILLSNNSNNNNYNSNNNNCLRKKNSDNLNLQKNSLTVLEDEYWRLILESNFISTLKIPVLYIKHYSNELNDFYLEKLYDYLVKWLVNRYVDEENQAVNTHNSNQQQQQLNYEQTINNDNNPNYNNNSDNNNNLTNNFRTEFSEDIHLDDSDAIKFCYTLNIIMKVVMNANIMNKQKCLIDLYMLTIYNRENSVTLLKNKYFHQWLLDLLLPYQILISSNEKFKASKESGIAYTILDLGCKIQTAILINSILNDKKYENENFILKAFNFILTWSYKIKTIGQTEGEAAAHLIRNLLIHLIKTFSEHLRLMSPSAKTPMWHYYLNLTFVVYEFIFYSNFYKKILEKKIIFEHLEKNEIFAEIIQNLNYDMNQEKPEYGRHSCGNVSMMDLWLDKELLVALFECYKVIWTQINLKMVLTEKQSFFNFNINLGAGSAVTTASNNKDNFSSNNNNNNNLNQGAGLNLNMNNNDDNMIFSRTGDARNNQMNESESFLKNKNFTSNNANNLNLNSTQINNNQNNANYANNVNNNNNNLNNTSNNFKSGDMNYSFNAEEIKNLENKINKLIFETNANYYLEDLKLFMISQQSLYNQQANPHFPSSGSSLSEKGSKNNLMRILLNSLIILIMLSESQEEIQKWLDQLEKYLSFVLIASENSRLDSSASNQSPSEAFLTAQQESVCEIFIIAFYFLSDEIKSPRREKSSDRILRLFANSLKFLFAIFCLIAEKMDLINSEIAKKKESLLSSYFKSFKNMLYLGGKTIKYFSASHKILNEILLNLSKHKLFEIAEIQKWKASAFNGVIESFSDENWIFAFQENSVCFEIIKNQFQFNLYEKLINLKLLEAQDIVINSEICVKEKVYVNQLYRAISCSVRDSLNFVEKFLKNEIFKVFYKKKKFEYFFYKKQKELFLLKGAWSEFNFCNYVSDNNENSFNASDNENNYNNNNLEQLIASDFYKYKVSGHISATLSRNVLYPILHIRKYLPNFSKYIPQNLFLDEVSNKKLNENNLLININIKQINNKNIKTNFENNFAKQNTKQTNFGILDLSYENEDLDESSNNNFSKTINIAEYEEINNNKKTAAANSNKQKENQNLKEKENEKDAFGEISILKVKQITNKSNMFYKNSHFSDFIDKYANIEKLTKYFKLFYEKDFKFIIINLTEFLIGKIKSENPETQVFDVCMVKVSGHKKGKILINKDSIIFVKNIFDFFQTFQTKQQKTKSQTDNKCLESIFKPKQKRGQKFFLKIEIKNVKQIYKRRLYYKSNSLEIFLFKNKSYFFNFENNNDRNFFCNTAFDYCCLSQKFNLFLFEFHVDIKKNLEVLDKVKKEWIEWRMSNFDFLMNLNNMAGRSFHDLTQYPVFPWIISNYKNENFNLKSLNNNNFQDFLRDLALPIGALGSEDRKEMFMQNFKESCVSYENYVSSITNMTSNVNANKDLIFNSKCNYLDNYNSSGNNNYAAAKRSSNGSSHVNYLGNNNNNNNNPGSYNTNNILKELNNENYAANTNNFVNINNNNNFDKIEFNDGKYFFNSHYSNPFYVTNFLARVFPYTYCAIELQGDGFDNPNRQFLSIPKAFENCMSQSTDIRELTPEFYYLPEFLLNKNKIKFGKITEISDEEDNDNEKKESNSDKKDLKKKNKNFVAAESKKANFINSVETPAWSKDPCFFIYLNKIILESQFVSNKLNEWVDLIFGAKQRGKEAENAMNLFWNYTYEDEIDIDYIKEKDYEEFLSYISKVEFGQTPVQLFRSLLAPRNKKELTKANKIFIENKKSMKVFRSTSEASNHFRNRKETVKKMIVNIKSLENNKLICVYNSGVVKLMKYFFISFFFFF